MLKPSEREKLRRLRRATANPLSRYLQDEQLALQLQERKPSRPPLGRRVGVAALAILGWLLVAGAILGVVLWLWLDSRINPPQ